MTEVRADGEGGWRSVLAGVLGVLAVVALTLGSIGIWANATVFESDEVADITAVALADAEVQSGLASWVTDGVFAAANVQSLVTAILPGDLERIGPTLVSGAEAFVDRELTEALSEPDVQQLLVQVVDRAHSALMDLLSGDGMLDGVSVEDGAVTVNMLPLVARGLSTLQELGLVDDLEVPHLAATDDPSAQLAALEEATGRDLPDDFGQLVVYESDRLAEAEISVENAQRAFALLKRATLVLVVLSVVFIATSLFLARRRWRAALWLGLGSMATMVLAHAVVDRVVDEAPKLVTDASGRAAVAIVVEEASRGLLRLTALLAIAAVLLTIWSTFKRGWSSIDLLLVGAVVTGVAVVAVVGFSFSSLLLAFVVAAAVHVVGRRALESRRRVATT